MKTIKAGFVSAGPFYSFSDTLGEAIAKWMVGVGPTLAKFLKMNVKSSKPQHGPGYGDGGAELELEMGGMSQDAGLALSIWLGYELDSSNLGVVINGRFNGKGVDRDDAWTIKPSTMNPDAVARKVGSLANEVVSSLLKTAYSSTKKIEAKPPPHEKCEEGTIWNPKTKKCEKMTSDQIRKRKASRK